jgi:heme/copper-type cytochrome/quinol oxidase subunit 4
MTRGSVLFLRAVVVLTAVGAAALMLWEPHLEGVNAQATNFEIYFTDPFLAYAYVASIPLFVGLYQGFRVLGYVGQDAVLSTVVVRRIRTIKVCAVAMIGFVVGAELFIRLNNKGDDPAGGVFIGLLIAFAATVVATTMFVLERTLQNAVDIKSENDLTV